MPVPAGFLLDVVDEHPPVVEHRFGVFLLEDVPFEIALPGQFPLAIGILDHDLPGHGVLDEVAALLIADVVLRSASRLLLAHPCVCQISHGRPP